MTDHEGESSTASDAVTQEEIDYFWEHCTDVPVACITLAEDDGLCVGIPGEIWADEYIVFWLHADGYVVTWTGEDGDGREDETLSVVIPLERLGEVRAAIDKAEATLRERLRTQPPIGEVRAGLRAQARDRKATP